VLVLQVSRTVLPRIKTKSKTKDRSMRAASDLLFHTRCRGRTGISIGSLIRPPTYCPVSWRSVSVETASSAPQRHIDFASDINAQRELMDRVGRSLGVKEVCVLRVYQKANGIFNQLSDWYSILRQDVTRRDDGGRIFDYYPSLENALQTIYPDFKWDSNQFAKPVPRGYWKQPVHLKERLESIGKQLGVEHVRFLSIDSASNLPLFC